MPHFVVEPSREEKMTNTVSYSLPRPECRGQETPLWYELLTNVTGKESKSAFDKPIVDASVGLDPRAQCFAFDGDAQTLPGVLPLSRSDSAICVLYM